MIDKSKILQLDYLKEFISNFNDKIEAEGNQKLDSYSLDMILSMENDEVIEIFKKYQLKCDSIIEKKDASFLDENWEFAYLFPDDLQYSMEQKKELDTKAWKEVLELNKKIEAYNNDILNIISSLKSEVRIVELLIKVLESKDLIYGDDINELKKLILTSTLIDDSDRFEVNLMIVNYLIQSKKKIIFSKDDIETEEFDKYLTAVHGISTYKSPKKDVSFTLPYQDTILKYYIMYKGLIDVTGFSNIFELMDASKDLVDDLSCDYLSKDEFCFQLGSLLYQLSNINDIELEKEILGLLSQLDSLYREDRKNAYKKDEMLKEIEIFFSNLDGFDLNIYNNLRTRLKVLKSDLDEIVSENRLNTLELEFNIIKDRIKNLSGIEDLIKQLNKYNQKIISIFNSSKLNNNDIELLSVIQDKLSIYEDMILSDKLFEDVSREYQDCFKKVDDVWDRLNNSKYVIESNNQVSKILLKGFVLCDFDENNKPYILSDLDQSLKSNLVDKSIAPKKLNKGYEDISNLINDLFLLGNTEKLNNNDSHGFNNDKVNQPIFWNSKNRTHENETGMYRIKYDRSGVERFVEQRIVLHKDSVMYNQFINIISEIIPNIEFDNSNDLNLYINYASAMKLEDEELYNTSINRFGRKSPLYRIFNEPKNKTELTDKECELLKDIIHASLDAFSKLDKINPSLHVDVIKQIGEGRSRG